MKRQTAIFLCLSLACVSEATSLVSEAPAACRLERGRRWRRLVCGGLGGRLTVSWGRREGLGCLYLAPHPFGRRGYDASGMVRVEVRGRPLEGVRWGIGSGVLAACRPADVPRILGALREEGPLVFRVGLSHAGEVPLGGAAAGRLRLPGGATRRRARGRRRPPRLRPRHGSLPFRRSGSAAGVLNRKFVVS